MKQRIKTYIYNHPELTGFFCKITNRLNPTNKIKFTGAQNSSKFKIVFLNKVKISVVGKQNSIIIDDFSRLIDCTIFIRGDNNTVFIGKSCYLYKTDLHIEDSDNSIIIGNNTTTDGKTHLAAIEGTNIIIGDDCMFSHDINCRTGDSHSIIDNESGKRINFSKDVVIGNHCWIGMRSIILKGVKIGSNSIVGAGSILLAGVENEHNVIYGGVPAKIIKRNINWDRKRGMINGNEEIRSD